MFEDSVNSKTICSEDVERKLTLFGDEDVKKTSSSKAVETRVSLFEDDDVKKPVSSEAEKFSLFVDAEKKPVSSEADTVEKKNLSEIKEKIWPQPVTNSTTPFTSVSYHSEDKDCEDYDSDSDFSQDAVHFDYFDQTVGYEVWEPKSGAGGNSSRRDGPGSWPEAKADEEIGDGNDELAKGDKMASLCRDWEAAEFKNEKFKFVPLTLPTEELLEFLEKNE